MEPAKTPRERAEDLISLLVGDWRPTPRQVLWAIRIAIILSLLVAIGYVYGITLWDWIKLLIVPAVIAAGGLWFNRQQHERGLEIENERAQDEALQAYLDQIGQLLLDKERPLRESKEGDEVRILARARTLTVLARLARDRKMSVIQFLYESGLIDDYNGIVDLRGADLSGANMSGTSLRNANMSNADLSNADLSGVKLSDANLSNADLSGALLYGAKLSEANLSRANLGWTNLRASLGWTEKQLAEAKTFEGTIMPDGQILRGAETPGGPPSSVYPSDVYASSVDGPTFEDWLQKHGSGESGRTPRGF